MVMTDMRRYVEATLEKMTPAKAQEMARSVMQGQGREQVQKFAQDLMDWSNKNRERLTELIRSEVRGQLKSLGVATRDDLDDLKRRVRALERTGRGASAAKRPRAKKTTAKRSTAKRGAAAGTTTRSTPRATG